MSDLSTTDRTMRVLAEALDDALNGIERPRKNGFILLTFGFDQPKGNRVNYISNAHREDVTAALKEIAERFYAQALAGD
ncbi:hypothetical protein G6K93_05905 [Agrobacterium rhizogenes]|nr:hypothetical protein [Rhizobium rhizogenes]